ncbi:hypothetical protein ABGT15_12965 [Flavobacterium enshiense]|uniref:hypothetical protein n=1 Tax=Flavobacterium enshiense TaxID=1341165 RepID=UPI00345DC088
MKTIQETETTTLLFFLAVILIVLFLFYKSDTKEIKSPKRNYDNNDSISKMYSWRVYAMGIIALLFFAAELINRLVKHL